MNFSRIFNVFSKREKLIEDKEVSLTSEFRVRIFLLWTKAFPKESESRWSLNRSSVWTDIYENLLFSLGTPRLSLRHKSSRYFDDLVHFIEECSDEHFLDFVELSFQSQHILEADMNVHDVINNVNQFFQEDNLPFSLTGFIFGQNDPRIVAYPQIIRRDSQLLHQTAIEPVLELLSNPAFRSANREFLEALSDYRKKDYGDCVVKCGSAFESVMKVICEQKNGHISKPTRLSRCSIRSLFGLA